MSRRRKMLEPNAWSRRDFLWKGACAALTATGIASTIWDLRLINAAAADGIFAAPAAGAAAAGDYKALVCIFLFGGNDGNNTLVPTDTDTYNNMYVPSRGSIALPAPGDVNGLLPIHPLTSDGHTYGLNPRCPELQALFDSGKLAILCNVGTLLAPLTQAQWRNKSVAVPPQLFSHSDQQIEWQTAIEDQLPRTGWGGRTADLLYSLNSLNNVSMNISLSGSNIFETGDVINEYSVSNAGAISLNIAGDPTGIAQLQALKDLIAMNHNNLYESAFSGKMSQALANADLLNAAIAPTAASNYFTTPFPNSGLGQQLKMIARLIQAAPMLGHIRQIFFAAIGGFDTHFAQGAVGGAQGNLLAEVSASMNALYAATIQLGVSGNVTQFTASDFSRTMPMNTGLGTDHAWGNHQFILGDSVNGKRMYGTYPTIAVNGPDDTALGRWIPTTAVEQYSATLAKWFGVSSGNMATVFPYLGRFATPDLGFMLPA